MLIVRSRIYLPTLSSRSPWRAPSQRSALLSLRWLKRIFQVESVAGAEMSTRLTASAGLMHDVCSLAAALPREILMYIFRWVVSSDLDMRTLEQLSLVCRGFYICARWRSLSTHEEMNGLHLSLRLNDHSCSFSNVHCSSGTQRFGVLLVWECGGATAPNWYLSSPGGKCFCWGHVSVLMVILKLHYYFQFPHPISLTLFKKKKKKTGFFFSTRKNIVL